MMFTQTVDTIKKAGRIALLGVIDLLLQVNMPISLRV